MGLRGSVELLGFLGLFTWSAATVLAQQGSYGHGMWGDMLSTKMCLLG